MKAASVSFYLGDKDTRDKRVEQLDRLAELFGLTRSGLLQKIANGELAVVVPETLDTYGTPGELYLERMGTFDFDPDDLKQMQTPIPEHST